MRIYTIHLHKNLSNQIKIFSSHKPSFLFAHFLLLLKHDLTIFGLEFHIELSFVFRSVDYVLSVLLKTNKKLSFDKKINKTFIFILHFPLDLKKPHRTQTVVVRYSGLVSLVVRRLCRPACSSRSACLCDRATRLGVSAYFVFVSTRPFHCLFASKSLSFSNHTDSLARDTLWVDLSHISQHSLPLFWALDLQWLDLFK